MGLMKNEKTPEGAKALSQNYDNTKYRLLSILQKSDKPVTRQELAARLNVSDRIIRQCKEELILEGYRIGSTSKIPGYKLDNPTMCLMSAREHRSRALKELRIAKILEGYDPNQITIDDLQEEEL